MDLGQLGRNIAKYRKALNMTQEDVSFELNISNTSYSRIESGKSDISFNRLLQIAQILKVPVSSLVQDSNTVEFTELASDIAQIKADVMLIKQSVVA